MPETTPDPVLYVYACPECRHKCEPTSIPPFNCAACGHVGMEQLSAKRTANVVAAQAATASPPAATAAAKH